MTDVSRGSASNGSRGSSTYDDESSSYHESYRIEDSDSDEDDKNEKIVKSTLHNDELDELREETKQLLDESWRQERNKRLLSKMLELDEPSISPKMVDFLLQEGVIELLLEFITQLGSTSRPKPNDPETPALKFSYRAAMLLSVDEPSDALISLLSRKARVIARAMMDVFRDDSAGSFYHSARVLESLLRTFPSEVFEGLTADGKLVDRMAQLLRYIGYPPVGDLLVILIALTPIPKSSQLYVSCAASRWKFFGVLSEWILMLRIADIVVNPNEYCYVDGGVSAEQQSSAAAQSLQELVEKLSIEDSGEILLQPLGYTVSLLNNLMNIATLSTEDCVHNKEVFSGRRSALRLLSYLLKRSANAESICFVSIPGAPPTPTVVPNRLHPLRVLIVNHLITRISDFEYALLKDSTRVSLDGSQLPEELDRQKDTSETYSEDEKVDSVTSPTGVGVLYSIPHPGHMVQTPFSAHRYQLMEYLVLLAEANNSVLQELSITLWKTLISWIVEFPHNNIYHSLFYRLLFASLRQNSEPVIKRIFKEAKVLTVLLDNFGAYVPNLDKANAGPGDVKKERAKANDRKSLQGFILNCCHATRLQASTLPPAMYLRHFLVSHQRWNELLPALRKATESQQHVGMGIKVPVNDPASKVGGEIMSQLSHLLPSLRDHNSRSGIDLGTAYAKSLGFETDVEWNSSSGGNSGAVSTSTVSSSKKKSKKKKKNHRRRRGKQAGSSSMSAVSDESDEDSPDDNSSDSDDYNEDDESRSSKSSRDSIGSADAVAIQDTTGAASAVVSNLVSNVNSESQDSSPSPEIATASTVNGSTADVANADASGYTEDDLQSIVEKLNV